jgi:hypothetical protein
MGGESSDFVSEFLGWDSCDFGQDLFINVEIVGQLLVVLFEQNLGSSLYGFCSDSSHL